MTETLGTLKSLTTDNRLRGIQPAAPFEQGHLRRQVIRLDHLNRLIATSEADILRAPIGAGAM